MKFWTRNIAVLLMVFCMVGCKPKQPPEPVQKELPKAPAVEEATAPAEAAPLKALLVTGQSAKWHPWRVSSPVLKQYLEDTGLFAVDVATTPAKGGDMETFNPNFPDYDVVVIDYEGDYWSESTQEAFVEYIKSGGGVVFYHAANNAFGKWK